MSENKRRARPRETVLAGTYCLTVMNGPFGVDTPSTVAVTPRSPSWALGGTRTTNWNSPAQHGAAPA